MQERLAQEVAQEVARVEARLRAEHRRQLEEVREAKNQECLERMEEVRQR